MPGSRQATDAPSPSRSGGTRRLSNLECRLSQGCRRAGCRRAGRRSREGRLWARHLRRFPASRLSGGLRTGLRAGFREPRLTLQSAGANPSRAHCPNTGRSHRACRTGQSLWVTRPGPVSLGHSPRAGRTGPVALGRSHRAAALGTLRTAAAAAVRLTRPALFLDQPMTSAISLVTCGFVVFRKADQTLSGTSRRTWKGSL
jgi:hypothetical protein